MSILVAERICGICGYMHGFGYCQTVEEVMGVRSRNAPYT